MSTTITLKNVPADVYQRLKESAELNRRSINSEAIVCLEIVLGRTSRQERLDRARLLRNQISGSITSEDIDSFKNSGRP